MKQYDRNQSNNTVNQLDAVGDEVVKHKKSKESSVSKSNKKSKHKHTYKKALIVSKTYDNRDHTSVGEYCTICGKLKITHYFLTVPCKNGGRLVLDDAKVYEMYGHLPKFRINDIMQYSIDIENDKIE